MAPSNWEILFLFGYYYSQYITIDALTSLAHVPKSLANPKSPDDFKNLNRYRSRVTKKNQTLSS